MKKKYFTDEERKEARRLSTIKYRKKNKDKIKEKRKKYLKNNKEKVDKTHNKYYAANREHILLKKKEYRENNKIKIKEYHSKWCSSNRDSINYYVKEKRLNEPLFKLSQNLRRRINKALKSNGFTKKSKTYQIIGLTYEELMNYIIPMMEPWMNWNNYGKYNGNPNYGWDIDHITPLASAKTEEELIKLCYYTNLRPLCSYFNRDIKKDNC